MKTSKIIKIYFVLIALSFFSVLAYSNYEINFEETDGMLDTLSSPISIKINYTKIIDIDKRVLFDTFKEIEYYPKILPRNHLSADVIQQTEKNMLVEHEIQEAGIKIKVNAIHEIYPYENQTIRITDGDANNTNIVLIFNDQNGKTKLDVISEIKVKGILKIFALLPEHNIQSAINTVVNSFVQYSKYN